MYMPIPGMGGGGALPSTGDGNVTFIVAVVGLVAGLAVVATTIARIAVKKAHKA